MRLNWLLGSTFAGLLHTGCGGDPVSSGHCPDGGEMADSFGMDAPDGHGGDTHATDGGDDATTTLTVQNEDLVARVNMATAFHGRVTGKPAAVYWDSDVAFGMMDMDVEGRNIKDDRYTGTLPAGYAVPGKYMHSMWAVHSRGDAVIGGTNLAKVLDTYVDVMGESLDEAYDDKQPELARGTVFSVWQDLIQADSRYSSLSGAGRDAIGDYERNLARPFGTKTVGQVRIAVFGDRGLVMYQLNNPDVYRGMENVFEGVEVSRDDALLLQEIIDSV